MTEHRAAATDGCRLLDPQWVRDAAAEVAAAEAELAARFHGGRPTRPAVHTVVVPARSFDAETATRWGRVALHHVEEYFPDFVSFAQALELTGFDSLPPADDRRMAVLAELEQDVLTVPPLQMGVFLASSVYRRMVAKLGREPVESLCIDFSDPVDDAAEAHAAKHTAQELQRATRVGGLPRSVGLRTQVPESENLSRILDTLARVLQPLAEGGQGIPEGFVVHLPGVTTPAQVLAVARGLARLESGLGLVAGSLLLDVVVETPRAILGIDGRSPLPAIFDAADGRLRTVHLGSRSYATACDRVATAIDESTHDSSLHQMVLAAFAGTGVDLADADIHPAPVPPVRQARGEPPLSEREAERNRRAVATAARGLYCEIRRAMQRGFYRGWDVHAAQLPIRFGAAYAFFLEHLRDATLSLRRHVDHAAHATRLGDERVDSEAGQSWLTFFQRGLACGALTEDEAAATGLTTAEIAVGSLPAVIEARRSRYREEMGD